MKIKREKGNLEGKMIYKQAPHKMPANNANQRELESKVSIGFCWGYEGIKVTKARR